MHQTAFEINRNRAELFNGYRFADKKESNQNSFWQSLGRAAECRQEIYGEERKTSGIGGTQTKEAQREETWEEKLQRFDEEMERIKEENERERKYLEKERIRKKRIQRKLTEKLAYKKYLAKQDEIRQMNEKIALERALGEDVYIEKAPLSKSLSVAEIMAICSEV